MEPNWEKGNLDNNELHCCLVKYESNTLFKISAPCVEEQRDAVTLLVKLGAKFEFNATEEKETFTGIVYVHH